MKNKLKSFKGSVLFLSIYIDKEKSLKESLKSV